MLLRHRNEDGPSGTEDAERLSCHGGAGAFSAFPGPARTTSFPVEPAFLLQLPFHAGTHVMTDEVDALALFPDEVDALAPFPSEGKLKVAGQEKNLVPATATPFETVRIASRWLRHLVSTPDAAPPEVTRRADERLASARALIHEVPFSAIGLEAQKIAIAGVRDEAARIGEVVSALEARIAKLTEKDQPLALGEARAFRLEKRGAQIAAHLEQSATVSKAQRNRVAAFEVQVGHIGEVVSGLEARIGKLIDRDQLLGRADVMVGRLEQRLAEATAELKRAKRAHDELGREVARLHEQVKTLRDSARNPVEKLAAQNEQSRFANSSRGPTRRAIALAKTLQVTTGRGAVVGGLIALALAGIIAARSRPVPAQERNGRVEQSALARLTPVLPGRPLGHAISGIQTLPTASRARMMNASVDARIASSGIRQTPAPVPQTPNIPAKERSSASSLVKNTSRSPEFIGALAVQSNPVGSAVFIDRNYVGETPVRLTQLRAGSHIVWIQREGYERWTASVLVSADRQTQVAATLQPDRNR